MSYLAYGFSYYTFSFFVVFISLHFEQAFGIQDKNMGYYFALLSLPSLVGALLFPILFANVPRKLQFILCFLMSFISMIFIGPSLFFGLPDKLYLILIGLITVGLSINLSMLPCLPEAMDFINQKYKIVEGYDPELENKLSDVLSSIFALCNYFFALVAPIIGATIYDNIPAENESE